MSSKGKRIVVILIGILLIILSSIVITKSFAKDKKVEHVAVNTNNIGIEEILIKETEEPIKNENNQVESTQIEEKKNAEVKNTQKAETPINTTNKQISSRGTIDINEARKQDSSNNTITKNSKSESGVISKKNNNAQRKTTNTTVRNVSGSSVKTKTQASQVQKKEVKVKSAKKQTTKKTKNNSNVVKSVPSTYKGYKTIGKIEIPKTGVNIPILKKQTVDGMNVAPCFLYTSGKLNYSGKTLIVGHNLRNGKIFSNNGKLNRGDTIYITTLDKKKVKYVVYSKYLADPSNVDYLEEKETERPEIILSSCTNDENKRVVILARAVI